MMDYHVCSRYCNNGSHHTCNADCGHCPAILFADEDYVCSALHRVRIAMCNYCQEGLPHLDDCQCSR